MDRKNIPRGKNLKRLFPQFNNSRCAVCDSDVGVELHHKIPVAQGGETVPSNLVALCYSCHKAIHNGKRYATDHNKNCGGRPKARHIDGYFTIEELANEIGCTKRNIEMHIQRGRLQTISIDGYRYVTPHELCRWQKQLWKRGK